MVRGSSCKCSLEISDKRKPPDVRLRNHAKEGLLGDMHQSRIRHLALRDQPLLFLVYERHEGSTSRCERRNEMRLHFSIYPINQAVGVVDLGEPLREQKLDEIESESVLDITHANSERRVRCSKVVFDCVADQVHAVVDAAADVGKAMREQIEVTEGEARVARFCSEEPGKHTVKVFDKRLVLHAGGFKEYSCLRPVQSIVFRHLYESPIGPRIAQCLPSVSPVCDAGIGVVQHK